MKGGRMEQLYTVNEAVGLINKARGFTWTWRDLFKAAYVKKDIGLMCYVKDIPVMKAVMSEDDYREELEYFTGYFNPLDTEEGRDYIYRLAHNVPTIKAISSFEGTKDGGVYDYFVIAKGALLLDPNTEIRPSVDQFYIDKADVTYFETEEKSSVRMRGITRPNIDIWSDALKWYYHEGEYGNKWEQPDSSPEYRTFVRILCKEWEKIVTSGNINHIVDDITRIINQCKPENIPDDVSSHTRNLIGVLYKKLLSDFKVLTDKTEKQASPATQVEIASPQKRHDIGEYIRDSLVKYKKDNDGKLPEGSQAIKGKLLLEYCIEKELCTKKGGKQKKTWKIIFDPLVFTSWDSWKKTVHKNITES